MSDAAVATRADDPTGLKTPACWYDVLFAECTLLDPRFDAGRVAHGSDGDPDRRLLALNRAALEQEHSALCLSGGGIRSASFAVGVLQGLARGGVLDRFDYLSTVSGGGFAGAWISGWIHRSKHPPTPDAAGVAESVAAAEALHQLKAGGVQPGRVEPWPLSNLRNYTRYMSPQAGMFSADFWGLIATVGRNLLLNWIVLLPLLVAAMLVPRFQFALIHVIESDQSAPALRVALTPGQLRALLFESARFWTPVAASLSYAVAFAYIAANLPSYGNRGGTQRQFLMWCLVPLCLGTLALNDFWAMWDLQIGKPLFIASGAVVHALVWIIGGLVTGSRPFRPRTWMSALAAGAFGAVAYELIVFGLFNYDDLSKSYVTTAFPLVMSALLLQAVVFVGLAGKEMTTGDLEWWSRAGAWILITTISWFAVCLVTFGGPLAVRQLMAWSPVALKGLGGLTVILGGLTSWLAQPTIGNRRPSPIRTAALAMAAPAFVLFVMVAMALFNEEALQQLAVAGDRTAFMAPFQSWPICRPEQVVNYAQNRCHPADAGLAETATLFIAFLGLGLLASRFVPANKFSLHTMYRNRVARAFLGSSRIARRPNLFTGFDPDDDIELAKLAGQRPFHVVNATLNTRTDLQLGRQERHAMPFTFTPMHAGSVYLGYRPAAGFAYEHIRQRGITLGTAATISGAAASPVMGEYTTPSLAFILTLFNARLGVWLGNPGTSGAATWRSSDPKAGIGPIVREMLGLTTDINPYIYLSDGGHFDNLGLWEMIHRRCKFIVVVDASCDPAYSYSDLANAIRQVRIDHGVRIELAPVTMGEPSPLATPPHVLAGTIRYDDAGSTGTIIYIKPSLTGDEQVDVLNYQRVHPAFPHESTAEQWFTEAQFESYRMLGLHSVEVGLADRSENGLGALAERMAAASTRHGPIAAAV